MIGEALGEEEELYGEPFVGVSGRELRSMAIEAKLFEPTERRLKYVSFNDQELLEASLRLDNVFMSRPPENKLPAWCAPRKDLPKDYPALPAIEIGNYLRPEYFHHLRALDERLREAKPNLIVALGNTACWFLLGHTGISKIRGYLHDTSWGIVLPTYHPAAVLRNWSLRPIVIADLMKAKAQAERRQIIRPVRELWIEPAIQDLQKFYFQHILKAKLSAFDIETEPSRGIITCISFSRDDTHGITIPITDTRKPNRLYWPDAKTFGEALKWISLYLRSPVPKATQNGMYDVQWLLTEWGMWPRQWREDSMLAHWSFMPEMQKSLDFLASIYTDEAPWKYWRRSESRKKDG